jgi:AraC-like DNA-binding protein
MRHVSNIETRIESRSPVGRRRRVDWPLILGSAGTGMPAPKVMDRPAPGQLAALLSAFDEILALEDPDAILRRSVEVAREKIGLVRAGIFLLDSSRDMMLGTWGADLHGVLVDEHRLMYSLSNTDREAFRRAREEGAHFTVFEDHPIAEHRGPETKLAGRGWVACTPIISAHATIGMLFNDGGLSGAPVDDTKQAHAALLCSLLGTILDPVRGVPGVGPAGPGDSQGPRLVTKAVAMVVENPAIEARAVAQRLQVSSGRLARRFKAEMGMSLLEFRNRARLDRVDALLADGQTTLLQAALAAGFGSYAQFHRVFRSIRHVTPRDFLRRRR